MWILRLRVHTRPSLREIGLAKISQCTKHYSQRYYSFDIYIYTQNSCIYFDLTVGAKAQQATMESPLQSNCGGIGGILPCGGHIGQRRVL